MKIVYNSLISKLIGRFNAIVLFGTCYANVEVKDSFLRHEETHARQQKELGWRFYTIYILQWIRTGFNYKEIPLEKEARANEL